MDERELKTSLKQRIMILAIAAVMVGSIVAGYAVIVASGNSGSSDTSISDEKVVEYLADYEAKLAEFQAETAGDYATYAKYLDRVKSYDEAAANEGDVKTRDLLTGSGRTLAEGDTDYMAYYVGWCADGTKFDSSLDNADDPTGFSGALVASGGLIEGWTKGVVGMKLGGVREITIPGQLAYGEYMEICGGYSKPLKFLIMAVANEDPLATLSAEVNLANTKLQYAYYGLDYEKLLAQ